MERRNILKRLFEDELFLTKELDGKRIIVDAKDTFAYIDSDFKKFGLDKPGAHTSEISIKVDELIDDGTFMDIFESLPGTRKQKLLTQDQIIETCKTRPGLLQNDSATVFFTEKTWPKFLEWLRVALVACKILNPQVFVVSVSILGGGLSVGVSRLGSGLVWDAEGDYRVVSPQLPRRY
jgi:hypothetical protein